MIYHGYEIDHIVIDYQQLYPEVEVKVKIGKKSKTLKWTITNKNMRNLETELQHRIEADIQETKEGE